METLTQTTRRPPYEASAAIIGTFVGGMGIAGIVARSPFRRSSPRFGRLLTWSLAAAGANDWLQAGFSALSSKASELDERS